MATIPNPLLDTIKSPVDLRALPEKALRQVADELRSETIGAAAITGGHLGAGLHAALGEEFRAERIKAARP